MKNNELFRIIFNFALQLTWVWFGLPMHMGLVWFDFILTIIFGLYEQMKSHGIENSNANINSFIFMCFLNIALNEMPIRILSLS